MHNTLLRVITFVIALLSVISLPSFSEELTWQADDYTRHLADINGDGLADLILQPTSDNLDAKLYFGELSDGENVVYPTELILPSMIES